MSQWKKAVLFIAPPCKISDKFLFKIKETTERGELTFASGGREQACFV